jgi:hypothetical protein
VTAESKAGGPKTVQGKAVVRSTTDAPSKEKRGNGEEVTQQGYTS